MRLLNERIYWPTGCTRKRRAELLREIIHVAIVLSPRYNYSNYTVALTRQESRVRILIPVCRAANQNINRLPASIVSSRSRIQLLSLHNGLFKMLTYFSFLSFVFLCQVITSIFVLKTTGSD